MDFSEYKTMSIPMLTLDSLFMILLVGTGMAASEVVFFVGLNFIFSSFGHISNFQYPIEQLAIGCWIGSILLASIMQILTVASERGWIRF